MIRRRIEIDLKRHRFINFPCVYRIQYGRLFYIGRSKHFPTRMKQHEAAINKLIQIYGRLVNIGGTASEMHLLRQYGPLVQYLFENPEVRYPLAEILESHNRTLTMCRGENALLRHYEGHKDCINNTFWAPVSLRKLKQQKEDS